MAKHAASQFQSLVRPLINRPFRLIRLLALLLITMDPGSRDVSGQLLFNTQTQAGERLIQLNDDGSTSLIQISDLPQAANPTVSINGRFLAVRSQFPNRPNVFSTNVFVFDSADGSTRQITRFNQDEQDPQTGATFNNTPRYSSFSPDGQFIAISNFLNTQTSQGSSTTNLFSIFRVSNGDIVDGPTIISRTELGGDTIGEGISWSPLTNEIALPAAAPIPGSTVSPTAIFGGNPLFNIPIRQLTFPRVFNGGQSYENDLFPQFSPDGQALAYFRTLTSFGQQAQISLRITSPAGDRAIPNLNFPQGVFPTGLTWSPDGSQLAFGVGTQRGGGGIFFNLGNISDSEIFTINPIDGSNFNRILTASAFSPTWSPGVPGGNTGDFNNDGQVNVADVDFYRGNLGQAATGSLAQLDLDGNNTITLADHDLLITQFLQTSAGVGSQVGDINFDGTVNVLGDAFILIGNLNRSGQTSYGQGDLNADGQINVLGDAFRLIGNLGQ